MEDSPTRGEPLCSPGPSDTLGTERLEVGVTHVGVKVVPTASRSQGSSLDLGIGPFCCSSISVLLRSLHSLYSLVLFMETTVPSISSLPSLSPLALDWEPPSSHRHPFMRQSPPPTRKPETPNTLCPSLPCSYGEPRCRQPNPLAPGLDTEAAARRFIQESHGTRSWQGSGRAAATSGVRVRRPESGLGGAGRPWAYTARRGCLPGPSLLSRGLLLTHGLHLDFRGSRRSSEPTNQSPVCSDEPGLVFAPCR